MKLPAYLLTLLMLCMMAQPLLVECQAKKAEQPVKPISATTCCRKKTGEERSSEKKCDSNKTKDCENTNTCNPFASCSQCQYTAASKFLYNSALASVNANQQLSPAEKTVTGFYANCWQPPEYLVA